MPVPLQTAIWFRRAQWMMSQCAARFGETFTLRIFHEGSWVMLSNPEHVKQVFTGDPRIFHAGEGNRVLLPFLGYHSLLLLDEEPHMEQRKLLLPPFHGKRMQRYRQLMAAIAAAEIERWPVGEPYRLRPRMQAITLEIILRTVFGLERGPQLEQLRLELRRLLDLLTQPQTLLLPMLIGPERLVGMSLFHRLHARVDHLIFELIAERRRARDLHAREDVLSMLLEARHESDGSPMSDQELRDQLLTLLTAGHETTATALSWAVERLIRHPDKLARLAEEVDAGEERYLEAVVTETLRLRPVISLVARRLREPVEIGGWQLPAGVTVTPSIYLVHRRPDVYPNPERFEPERFLERSQPDDPGAAVSGAAGRRERDDPRGARSSEAGGRARAMRGGQPGTYTWIPFGGGVRRCIGGSFAHFEMQVVLAELVKRRRLRPARPDSERVFRRAITETPRRDAEVVLA